MDFELSVPSTSIHLKDVNDPKVAFLHLKSRLVEELEHITDEDIK